MLTVFNALKNARAASLDRQICYQEVADQTGFSRSTLSRNDQRVTVPRVEADLQQRKLSLQQELDLCDYIEELTERHLPPTRQIIKNFAAEITKDHVGET
ncbi:uncharacterized protein M421DRAFT_411755 [Didymella exigua CBS 183.55]|uniref:HTH CENPB-type domain-containing protein n=1 Tax=Didymella exigua CBS 183.55 TaxID=1150837 RepID=A0A6A5R433_9PLEO|nr:uncharacterized protein M421DRAFT_411755 [Didymella exigua CBS 183.55]KAF1922393.1 hypothetical protein M421DRAFT_411755 [Didymella exigua CBS 183.55]